VWLKKRDTWTPSPCGRLRVSASKKHYPATFFFGGQLLS
jgi:hypothetical protein